jgi:hypothetical protein
MGKANWDGRQFKIDTKTRENFFRQSFRRVPPPVKNPGREYDLDSSLLQTEIHPHGSTLVAVRGLVIRRDEKR